VGGNETTTGNGGGVGGKGDFLMNGGTISGNTAALAGGGVYVNYGEFTMNGGTIFGGDDMSHEPKKGENTATSGEGHAVYAIFSDGNNRWRNDTAGPGVNLSVKYDVYANIDTGALVPSSGWSVP
jgi:hypothetical protein